MDDQPFELRCFSLELRVAGLRLLRDSLEAPLDVVAVGNEQLEAEPLEIALRIGVRRESVQDEQQRIDLAKVAEERCPRSGDIYHANGRRRHLASRDDGCNAIEARVCDRCHAHVRLRRRAGVRGDVLAGARERMEQRRLPCVRKPDDADLESHASETKGLDD